MGEDAALQSAEEKINTTMQQISRCHTWDMRRLQFACDSLNAMSQVLTRLLLMNIPEPPADVKAALRATANGRYNNLLKLAHKHYEIKINERKELESNAE